MYGDVGGREGGEIEIGLVSGVVDDVCLVVIV